MHSFARTHKRCVYIVAAMRAHTAHSCIQFGYKDETKRESESRTTRKMHSMIQNNEMNPRNTKWNSFVNHKREWKKKLYIKRRRIIIKEKKKKKNKKATATTACRRIIYSNLFGCLLYYPSIYLTGLASEWDRFTRLECWLFLFCSNVRTNERVYVPSDSFI